MVDATKTGDLDAWAAADDDFHITLLKMQGNTRLRGFVESLYDQVHRARIITLRLRDTPVQSTAEHQQILKALREGDAETAYRTFREHRTRASHEILNILESYKLPQL